MAKACHLEKETLCFQSFLQALNIWWVQWDTVQCISLLTHWPQKSLRGTIPRLLMKVHAFLLSRKISKFCILLFYSLVSCSHGTSGWEITVMFIGHFLMLIVACYTVRSATMDTIPFEGCTNNIQTTFSGALS